MSRRRELKDLLAEDDALPLIQKAVDDGNRQIKVFAACGEEDEKADEWAMQSSDDDDDSKENSPSDRRKFSSHQQHNDNDANSSSLSSGSVSPTAFEHVLHRLLPIIRDTDEDEGENDGEKKSKAAAPQERVADPGEEQLLSLQVTTHSALGAMAYHHHQLLAYNGLVRVLGAGRSRLIPAAGPGADQQQKQQIIMHSCSSLTAALKPHGRVPSGCLVIAFDVFGGIFLLNSGSITTSKPGNVVYIAPDDCDCSFEDLGIGYTAWLFEWLMNSARIFLFYHSWLFPHFERAALAELGPTEAWAMYPPLWAKEAPSSRKAVPIEEVFALRFAPVQQDGSDGDTAAGGGDGGEKM